MMRFPKIGRLFCKIIACTEIYILLRENFMISAYTALLCNFAGSYTCSNSFLVTSAWWTKYLPYRALVSCHLSPSSFTLLETLRKNTLHNNRIAS